MKASDLDRPAAALSLKGVVKSFGGAAALKNASVEVERGTIHALVGENGAGKSTLLGVMSGRVVADRGTVEILGSPSPGGDPRKARTLGLVTVYQELTMVPTLTAAQNVFLGQAWTRGGFLRTSAMRTRFAELCEEFDLVIPPDTVTSHLSVSHQQVLEILRGVQANAQVVLLDEPTATLAEHERASLYRILHQLRDRGITIVLVSHNLQEVFELSDRITVMRNGEVIQTNRTKEWTRPSLIEAMVGRSVTAIEVSNRSHSGEEVLRVENVRPRKTSPGISATIHRGEIVGLWGLVGSGRTSFLRSICGSFPGSSGDMQREGNPVTWPGNVRRAHDLGIVMVPESRKEALVMGMSGRNNFWLGRHAARSPFVNAALEAKIAKQTSEFFAFDTRRIDEPVRNLSGGNQQKILLTKAAGRDPDVLVVDEPTRGIDVGAKSEVLQSLVNLADQGTGVLVTSSELEEVLSIASRILVFAHGAVVREIGRTDPLFNVDDIVALGFSDGSEPA